MLKNALLLAASNKTENAFLYSWGVNTNGCTGLGIDTGETLIPTSVTGGNWITAIANTFCGIAIRDDNTLWSWGWNFNGQTGLGTDVGDTLVPTQVGADTDWVYASRSFSLFCFAIKTNGTLWSWGDNASGATGLNTTVGNTLTPTQVGTDTDWVKVTGGGAAAVGLKTDNTIWAWGANNQGRTGLGIDTGNTLIPTQIGVDTDWIDISTGNAFSLALKSNNTLWSFGDNTNNRNGQGLTTGGTLTPTQIGTDTDWLKISAGSTSGMAIKTDGTLWAWGFNNNGQTALGVSTGDTLVITQVGVDTDWVEIQAGESLGFALKTNGTRWAWGQNSRLGINQSVGLTLAPVQADADNDWIAVSGVASVHGLGLKS